MTRNLPKSIGRCALWFSPLLVVIVGFLSAIPWMKQQSDALVMTLTAAVSIFVMGYSVFLANRQQRRLDEVQIASQGFATSRGWTWGAMATVVLLTLPPVANGLVDLANRMGTGSPDTSDRDAVRLALFFGFMLVVFMQLIAVMVASAIWQWRMARP